MPKLGKHAPEKVVEAPLRKVETQKFGATFPMNVPIGNVEKVQVPILMYVCMYVCIVVNVNGHDTQLQTQSCNSNHLN